MELTSEQKCKLILAHRSYIQADTKLALAVKEVEIAKARVELETAKMGATVDAIAIELGLNKPEHEGRYNLNMDMLTIEDKRPEQE